MQYIPYNVHTLNVFLFYTAEKVEREEEIIANFPEQPYIPERIQLKHTDHNRYRIAVETVI